MKFILYHSILTTLVFLFVPSHIGIPGNERADRCAREARDLSVITDIMTCGDLRSHLEEIIKDKWDQEWGMRNSKLKNILTSTKCKLILPTTRRHQVALTRLRIGHTRLTHEYLFRHEEPPVCVKCQKPLTVYHLILECRDLEEQRTQCGVPGTLQEALGGDSENTQKLINFLHRTNVINKI